MSILFGPLELRRVTPPSASRTSGTATTRANHDPQDTSVGGIHAFFLILGEPEAYGLPPKPQVPTIYLKDAWTSAFATAIGAIIISLAAFWFSKILGLPHRA